MSIKDYIEKNWTDDFFYKSFSISGYKKRLAAIMEAHSAFAHDLLPILECGSLSREKVFDWVKNDSYQGFIAAMLWGWISTVESKNKKSNAEMAFTFDKDKVVSILSKTAYLLQHGKEDEAFIFLSSPEGKIPGIGISYFTKIMYFFSPGEPNESLIFDRWGRFMHAAFLIDEQTVDKYYSFSTSKLELVSKIPEKDLYLDYLAKMRSIKIKGMSSPGHLEAFLFGRARKGRINKTNNNPRFFLFDKVKSYFTGSLHNQYLTTKPNNNPTKKTITKRFSQQSLSLRVYKDGETIQIVGRTGTVQPANKVLIQYKERQYMAQVGTYNNGHRTLRDKTHIKKELIEANGWKPDQVFQCEFVENDGTHIYRIK